MRCRLFLSKFIEQKQQEGCWWFSSDEYCSQSPVSSSSFNQAVYRLVNSNKLVHISHNFYVIIPLEYQNRGYLPTSFYIDHYMRHLKIDYYVGLLSAASFHGVSHQQPQQFQVMLSKQIILGKKNTPNINFTVNKKISSEHYVRQKCKTGYFNLATKEIMLLDLVHHYHLGGGWSNIATIIDEVVSEIDPGKLASNSRIYPKPTLQRLGYMIDYLGYMEKTHLMLEHLKGMAFRDALLTPEHDVQGADRNIKWKLILNDIIEVDV